MDEDIEPQTLRTLFAKAEEKRLALDRFTSSTTDEFQETLSEAVDLHHACLNQARKLSLFSANETLEDISTATLPYLLLEYQLAELLQRRPSQSNAPTAREAMVRQARAGYEAFLTRLDGHEMLGGNDLSRFSAGAAGDYAKLWDRYRDDPDGFSTTAPAHGAGGGDGVARRNAKIANYKAEKALKEKLALLQRDPRYAAAAGDEDADDETARELYLARLAFAAHMTFQVLESLNREMEVLAQAPAPLIPHSTPIEQDERERRETQEQQGYNSTRLDKPLKRLQSMFGPGAPLLTKEGKPLQPFTIVGTRSELQKGVFRPGHNLPTMTIDEYLDEERRRGNILEGGGEASFQRPDPDEDNIEKADQATYKARAWDEFTEENPRGSGNTLNRG